MQQLRKLALIPKKVAIDNNLKLDEQIWTLFDIIFSDELGSNDINLSAFQHPPNEYDGPLRNNYNDLRVTLIPELPKLYGGPGNQLPGSRQLATHSKQKRKGGDDGGNEGGNDGGDEGGDPKRPRLAIEPPVDNSQRGAAEVNKGEPTGMSAKQRGKMPARAEESEEDEEVDADEWDMDWEIRSNDAYEYDYENDSDGLLDFTNGNFENLAKAFDEQ